MRICIPTMGDAGLEETLHGHFGSATSFTICDTDTDEVTTLANTNTHLSHGNCQPLQALGNENLDAILTGGMGRRAVMKMNEGGIKVYQLQGATVAEALAAFKAGELKELTADMACGGHGSGCSH